LEYDQVRPSANSSFLRSDDHPYRFDCGFGLVGDSKFLIGIIAFTSQVWGITLIPQIGLDEGWDRVLIKPFMIGGILLFGLIPTGIAFYHSFAVSKQFVWALLTLSVGMTFVALILVHVHLGYLEAIGI